MLTVVITHNPELEEGQMQGVLINIQNTNSKLLELQQRLMRRASGEVTRGKKPTVESVSAAVIKTLSAEYMKDIFLYEVIEKGGNVYLTFSHSEEKLERIRCDHFGKKVLFTNRHDFTSEQIVEAYRNASYAEASFRQMNDPKHLAVRPFFHWTDEKIRIHIFTCVLAYRLCCLLVKELSDKGISITINRLIEEMTRIKRINTFFGDIDNPEKVTSFTRSSDRGNQIESLYQLKEKYS